MEWKAKADYNFASDSPVLWLARLNDEKIQEVVSLTFEDRQIYQPSTHQPPISGHEAVSFMQAVMDAAYEYGLRPSAAQDERHMKSHLKDMQEITRHLLKMNKKP
ncbi:MAG: hypothetical protein GY938_31030 [Ketobacter sp.]|nr:hypothetical protein [Ketobacter sp.]